MNKPAEWSLLGTSRRGAAHHANNVPCQDSFLKWTGCFAGDYTHIVAVADGHGSAEYYHSHFGAFFAARAVYEEFLDFSHFYISQSLSSTADGGVSPIALEREYKSRFASRVLRNWRKKIIEFNHRTLGSEEFSDNDVKPFGCTLAAGMVLKGKLFIISIGDSDVYIHRSGGEIESLRAEEEEVVGEETDSLASDGVELRAKIHILNLDDISLIMLSTDGLVKSFHSVHGEIIPAGIFKTIEWLVHVISENKVDLHSNDFIQFLDNCSQKGSGDDVSVAILYDRERIIDSKKRTEKEESSRIEETAKTEDNNIEKEKSVAVDEGANPQSIPQTVEPSAIMSVSSQENQPCTDDIFSAPPHLNEDDTFQGQSGLLKRLNPLSGKTSEPVDDRSTDVSISEDTSKPDKPESDIDTQPENGVR